MKTNTLNREIDVNTQMDIINEAREFTEKEIRPYAGDFERQEAIPRELINKMAEKKYIAAPFPEEYGGLNLDPLHYGYLTEEIGKGCPSTRALLTVHTSLVGETLLKWGSEEQKKKWLPEMAEGKMITAFALSEPDIGSNAKGIKTSYEEKENMFILNGKKKWITYGDIADAFLVVASNEDKITTFLVKRNSGNIKTTPIQGLMASKAAHVAEIEFNNVEIPKENVIGRVGNGFTYIVNTALDFGRYSIAWAGVSLAEAALEAMVTYARTRNQFGQKLYKFQLIHELIADATTNTLAARNLCENAGRLRCMKDEDAVMHTNIAKYFSSKVAMKIAIDAVQVHGGNGCCSQYPVERLFREAKVLEIIEGTSQIQQEIISRYGLKNYYRIPTK